MKQNYTKTRRICDTSKWITHSTQHRTEGLMSLILIGLCICFSFISCGKTEEDEEVTPPSEPTLELSDICGVWTKSNNSLYYIAIYPNGKYSYCFNNRTISSGICSLSDNTLYLTDEYTFVSDQVTVKKNANELSLSGYITNIYSAKEIITHPFIHSSESLSPSIAGIRKTSSGGLNMYYDNLKEEIAFLTDVIFRYEYSGRHKSTHQYKTISQYTWRYVYRKPYTYGIKINTANNENNTVEIYDFPFIYNPDWGTLDLGLDGFIIEQ